MSMRVEDIQESMGELLAEANKIGETNDLFGYTSLIGAAEKLTVRALAMKLNIKLEQSGQSARIVLPDVTLQTPAEG